MWLTGDCMENVFDFGKKFKISCYDKSLSEVVEKFKELTQYLCFEMQDMLKQVDDGKMSAPAFFYFVKDMASDLSVTCTDVAFDAVKRSNLPEPEKMALCELMCGQRWKKGDVIWKRSLETDTLTLKVLCEHFWRVEKRDTRVARVWMSFKQYAEVVKFAGGPGGQLDTETSADKLKQGIYGYIFGTEIHVSKQIPEDYLVVVGEDEEQKDLANGWIPAQERLIHLKSK